MFPLIPLTPPRARGVRRPLACATIALLATLAPAPAVAVQDHIHGAEPGADPGHHEGLHFTHPLFAESVSPDTKLRLDFARRDMAEAEDDSELELEGEIALARFFSIEAGVHIEPDGWTMGETHLMAKFANYAFEEAGVLLGYGIGVGLPTGGGHGHDPVEGGTGQDAEEEDIYEITPFLNGGWTGGPWEVVGWTLFEIPTNQETQDDVGAELAYHASVLYKAGRRVDVVAEGFGHVGLSGPETDRSVVNVAPGLRVRVLEGRPLVLGAGVAVPLTTDTDFDTRILVSAFWHF